MQTMIVQDRPQTSINTFDSEIATLRTQLLNMKQTDRGYREIQERFERLRNERDIRKANRESKQRQIKARMERNGLYERLKSCRFETYGMKSEWQRRARGSVIAFTQSVLNGGHGWLYVGGQSGAGKSHLCLASVGVLLNHGILVWCESFPDLFRTLKDKKYGQQSEESKRILKRVKTEPVLYVDDFLKEFEKKDSSFLFEIIDFRYNSNLTTIISSEFHLSQVYELNEAVGGRIKEKCKSQNGGAVISIENSIKNNFRIA